jgi:YHS domain-containing protein
MTNAMTLTKFVISPAHLMLCAAFVLTTPMLRAQDGMMQDTKPMHAEGAHSQNTDAAGIAVKGYDVVAYQTQNAAVAGSAAFVATHQGATFRFASAANRDAFVAQPARFLPQYGGYCAMGVAVGRKFDIDPKAFRVVDGKLYLNKNEPTQRMWLRDVPRHIMKGDAQWATVSMRAVDQ